MRNYNGAGTLLSTTFKVCSDSAMTADCQTYANVSSKDVFVPAGTYYVSATGPTGGVLAAAVSYGTGNTIAGYPATAQVSVTVAAGVNSAYADLSVTAGAAVSAPASVKQTGVFVWQYQPKRTATKARYEKPATGDPVPSKGTAYTSGMGDARFDLYKLNAAGTLYERVAQNFAPNATTGVFTTDFLTAGSYFFVETALPSSAYLKPAYVAALEADTDWSDGIPEALVASSGASVFTITTGSYSDTASATLSVGEYVNVPKNTLNVTKRQSGTSTLLGDVEFKLCANQAMTASCATYTTGDTGAQLGKFAIADLAPGTYYLQESQALAGYVSSDAILKIEIDSDGWPSYSWLGDTQPGTTTPAAPNRSAANATASQIISDLTVTNSRPPDVGFVKYGQTSEWDNDGNRQKAILPGAGFTLRDNTGLYYTIDGTGKAVLLNGTGAAPAIAGTVIYESADPATDTCADYEPDLICTDALGHLDIKALDPAKRYFLDEVFVPEIIGPATPDGLEYEPEHVRFRFVWSATANSGAGGWITVQNHDTGQDPDDSAWYADSDGRHAINNTTDPHHIRVDKLPIKLADGASVAGGMVADGSWDDVKILESKFRIYAWVAVSGNIPEDHKGALVDTITMGVSEITGSNYGISTELPPGKYIVEEYIPPMFYPPDMTNPWDPPLGYHLANPQGDQTTAVYYQCNATTADLDAGTVYPVVDPGAAANSSCPVDGAWIPANSGGEKPVNSAVVEIPVTEGEDGEVTFGDSNRVAAGDGYNESRVVAWFGEKSGYKLDPLTGRYVLDEPDWRLGGITFNVYPAYVDANGQYHILPTIVTTGPTAGTTGVPITTTTSNLYASQTIKEGQFLSEHVDIAGVFACPTDAGQACEDWSYWDTTSGDWRYAQYGANGGKPNLPGAITVNWAAVPVEIKLQYANSYNNNADGIAWSVVFVEQPKTGSSCNPAPGPCSPLPGEYEFDIANPPQFGISINNSGVAITSYFKNGDSQSGTTPADADPEPYDFPNYKGTGYLRLQKRGLDTHGTADTADDTTALTPGARFEFYLVDPDHIDGLNTAAGRALALQYATKVLQDRSSTPVSLDPYIADNSGGDGYGANLKLQAGTYLIKEIAPASGYNAAGTFTSDAGPDGNIGFNDPGNQDPRWDTSGSFSATEVAIGRIIVPQAGDTNHATRVVVTDQKRPDTRIVNTWSGASVTDTSYTGTYHVTCATPCTWAGASGTDITSAGSGNPSGTLGALQDGSYTFRVSAISRTDFNINSTANTADVTFTVSGGAIVTAGADQPKVNGVNMANSAATALATTGNGVWWTAEVEGDQTIVVFHVNHIAKGQLVILKGIKDQYGIYQTTPPAGSSAVFAFECATSCPGTEPDSGTLTWTAADNASGGKRLSLDPGVYKVSETSVSAHNWLKDGAEVYVEIQLSGATYLVNAPASGAGATQGNPLTASNNPAYFYNTSTLGTFEVKKFDDTSDTVNLAGAEFKVYDYNATDTSGPSTAALASPVATVAYNNTPADANYTKYIFTVPAGTYWLQESQAPGNGEYARRTDFVKIEVLPGQAPVYLGYQNSGNKNVAVILDPKPLTLDVAKETTYTAIGTPGEPGYVAARDVRISLLPMFIFKRVSGAASDYSKGNFELLRPGGQQFTYTADAALSAVNGAAVGTARFPITEPGEYRVVELVPESHKYLLTNSAYKVQHSNGDTWEYAQFDDTGTTGVDESIGGVPDSALLGTAASIFVVYDEATNSLKIDTSKPNPGFKETWPPANGAQPTSNLTINNEFTGYVITVLKKDAQTGQLVTAPNAEFELYDTEAEALAGGHAGQIDDTHADVGEWLRDTSGTGVVTFRPRYASPTQLTGPDAGQPALPIEYWVREEQAPNGYTLDPWYDAVIKKVVVYPADRTTNQYVVEFKDGKPEQPSISLAKGVKNGASGSAANPVAAPLNNSGFSTTYTIAPNAPGNNLPLYNYTLSDGSATASAFSFRGTSKTGTEIDVAVDPAGTIPLLNPAPGAHITKVRIWPSTAYATVAAQALDTDTSGTLTSSAHQSAVYARVNGGAWTLLDGADPHEFAIPAADQGYLTIEYAQVIPGTGETAYVGSHFTPGAIEIDVTFDKFVPSPEQAEIAKIANTATATACLRTALDNGACKSAANAPTESFSASSTATINVPVDPRPEITVTKACTHAKCDLASGLDANQRNFYPGDDTEFTLTTVNSSARVPDTDPDHAAKNAQLAFTHPVVLDYMPEVFSMQHVAGVAQYSVTVTPFGGVATPYTGTVQTSEIGSVFIWEFPDLSLEPGDTLSVTYKADIARVVTDNNPINSVYVTSGKTPLLTSNLYPTGASFTVPNFDTSENAVFDEGYWTNPSVPMRQNYWDKLAAIPGFDPSHYGLFARAQDDGIVVKPSGDISRAKSLSINGSTFTSSETAAEVHFGDTVTFRLALQNGLSEASGDINTATNIRIADVLPFLNDATADGRRGTQWEDDLLDRWKYVPGSLSVYTQVFNAAGVNPSEYLRCSTNSPVASVDAQILTMVAAGSCSADGGDLPQDASAFVVNLGEPAASDDPPGSNFKLKPGDILFVEYTMAFDFSDLSAADAIAARHELLTANTFKIAVNDFTFSAQSVKSTGLLSSNAVQPSNSVAVKLRANPVTISGVAWNDLDRDGLNDSGEPPLANVPVELWQQVNGTVTKVVPPVGVTFPATTAADGSYAFTGLESSYGDGTGEIDYQVRFLPPTGAWAYTYLHAGTDPDIDSDAHPDDDPTTPPAWHKGETDWMKAYLSVEHVDAGFFTGQLAGYVWEDRNYNGVQDGPSSAADPMFENPLAGIAVSVYHSSDSGATWDATAFATGLTGPDGRFAFFGPDSDPTGGIDFSAGHDYRVVVESPSGEWYFTAKDAGPDDLDSDVGKVDPLPHGWAATAESDVIGNPPAAFAAGLYRLGDIEGLVWEDINDDGVQNDSFATGHDLSKVTARLIGTEWVDANGDGVQDPSELTPVDRTVNAGSDGGYVFLGVKRGSYTVTFDRADLDAAYSANSFAWAKPAQGADPAADSDGRFTVRSQERASTEIAQLGYADSLAHLDGGVVPYVHIKGYAWLDDSRDGVWQGGPFVSGGPESPFAAVTVQLWRAGAAGSKAGLLGAAPTVPAWMAEALVATTTTAADGSYLFDGLLYDAVSRYKVVFFNPNVMTYVFTVPGAQHTATYMVNEYDDWNGDNRYHEAHTDYAIQALANSDGEYNAGLLELPWTEDPVKNPPPQNSPTPDVTPSPSSPREGSTPTPEPSDSDEPQSSDEPTPEPTPTETKQPVIVTGGDTVPWAAGTLLLVLAGVAVTAYSRRR
ncbi:MAG: hypothetical protein LBQ92_01190 [Propionibacteriaceae bacterium]|nr:hypothetical protein [Propionibacteriaceae bacterium]